MKSSSNAENSVDEVRYAEREVCSTTYQNALDNGLPATAAAVIARRVSGLSSDMGAWLQPSLRNLPDPATLPDVHVAVERLCRALQNTEVIGLCTDYDVDGITAHTLLREALVKHFGHPVEAVCAYIGHRLTDGYGLSDNVCARILADTPRPAVVITADCGTSDGPRIQRLAAAGIDVIVTDHHGVPVDGVPADALATVNPSRPDADFPDPAIAGCTVAWLLMSQLRRALIDTGTLPATAPKLADSLDLVALGTVADAVSLFSPTNRAVVTAGLAVMNQRRRVCWQALAALLERGNKPFQVDDLGFQIGPRINARGRVADPTAALNFLTATQLKQASLHLSVLDQDNQSRRDIEQGMVRIAQRKAREALHADDQVVCVFDDSFHPGVQGIVASRLLERFGRVTAVLSPAREPNMATGSLRSIDGVDIGEGLRKLDEQNPGLLHRFGGHPKAAGVTLARERVDEFTAALAQAVRRQLGSTRVTPLRWHDGELSASQLDISTVQALDALIPYGRGFEPAGFYGEFVVARSRLVGADPVHLSLDIEHDSGACRGIWFRAIKQAGDPPPLQNGDRMACVYRLSRDDYRGGGAIQLIVEHAKPI
ncbi:MAG: single-stranded-DNA-specific exonuclease RecJ [Gammaproteobacteria bacterium]